MRHAPLVDQGRRSRGRFSSAGWRRRPPLWGRPSVRRGVVGYLRFQLGRGWRERQGRGRLASVGLGGGQSLQRAPQALIHIQVNVVQVGGGQVEAATETLHPGLRGRRVRRGELKCHNEMKNDLFQPHASFLLLTYLKIQANTHT